MESRGFRQYDWPIRMCRSWRPLRMSLHDVCVARKGGPGGLPRGKKLKEREMSSVNARVCSGTAKKSSSNFHRRRSLASHHHHRHLCNDAQAATDGARRSRSLHRAPSSRLPSPAEHLRYFCSTPQLPPPRLSPLTLIPCRHQLAHLPAQIRSPRCEKEHPH
jgi:hypothetical protein